MAVTDGLHPDEAIEKGVRCLMSAIGTKRTYACALQMSAFDPKRTRPAAGNDANY